MIMVSFGLEHMYKYAIFNKLYDDGIMILVLVESLRGLGFLIDFQVFSRARVVHLNCCGNFWFERVYHSSARLVKQPERNRRIVGQGVLQPLLLGTNICLKKAS